MKKFKLIEVCDIYDGVHITPKYKNSGIPFRTVENLYDLRVEKFVDEQFYNEYYQNKKITNESIYITRIGTIGKIKYITNNEEAYYVTLALLTNIKINALYLSYSLQSSVFQKELLRNSLLDAFPRKINMIDLKNCKVLIHENEKMQKIIGSFLKFWCINRLI